MGITKEKNKWRVRVTIKGKRTSLGYFKTRKEAEAALRGFHFDKPVLDDYPVEFLKPRITRPFRVYKTKRKLNFESVKKWINNLPFTGH